MIAVARSLDAVVAVLQGRPGEGFDLDTLVQVGIVFIFIVLPIARSVLEVRKRKAGGASKPRVPPLRPRAPVEPQGGDLWRELLHGSRRDPRPPAASRPPAAPRPVPTPASYPPQRAPAEIEGARLEAARRRRTEREAAVRAAEQAPRRAADQELGELRSSTPPAGAARLEPTVTAGAAVDPTTFHEEMLERWGQVEVSEVAAAPLELVGARLDWRQAVLVSELLSPPLALRGASSAFPGPPAALPS